MRNDTSFGSRVAATWRVLVEHMKTLSEAAEIEDTGNEPTIPSSDMNGELEEGMLHGCS